MSLLDDEKMPEREVKAVLGHPPEGKLTKIMTAYEALLSMEPGQREDVLRWFCRGCARHIGADGRCHCMRDE